MDIIKKDLEKHFSPLPENIHHIWDCAASEMINNAIDDIQKIIDSNKFIVHSLKDTSRIAHNQFCHVVAVEKRTAADGTHGSGQTQRLQTACDETILRNRSKTFRQGDR